MITKCVILFAGVLIGMFTTALAAAAGDAERCEDCLRMREELDTLKMEEELERLKAQIQENQSDE